jgi:dTDP-4-amino-4,6-dideoxygalactose transaminase
MSSKVHSPNHRHTMFSNFRRHLPNTDKFEKTHLCIPVGWWLTDDDRQKIVEKIIKYAK